MSEPEQLPNYEARARAELMRAQSVLRRTVEIVSPDAPEADPLTVFPAPNELRASDPGMVLSEEQAADLRDYASELGFGRVEDRTLSEQGLINANVIIEGGQPHKMAAELGVVLDDDIAKPNRIYVFASPHRQISNPSEIASSERLFGEAFNTEFDVAEHMIESAPGFQPDEYPIQFGYDIHANHQVVNMETGQFIMKGWIGGAAIILAKVDRENYNEEGKSKYRLQPQTKDLIKIVGSIQLQEDDSINPIAVATSSAYELSRTVDAVSAGLEIERSTGVVAYGTKRLAEKKGEDAPAPGPINQLPGELHKLAVHTNNLETVLDERGN
jgi:hypothetical protein